MFNKILMPRTIRIEIARAMHHVMNSIWPLLICTILTLISASPSFGDEKRTSLAVIADKDSQNEAEVLLASLSEQGHIKLVERDEMNKITREYRLASEGNTKQWGSLINLTKAQGLIILNKTQFDQKSTVVVRIVAVEPGVIIAGFTDPLPLQNITEWSSFTARRIAFFAHKIQLLSEEQAPLVFPGLRSVIQSTASVEKQVNECLMSHLLRSQKICLVERWSLPSVVLEKDLAQQLANPLSSANYLLEGTFQTGPSNVLIDVQLNQPGASKPPLIIQESDSRIEVAIEKVVRKIEDAMGKETIVGWSTSKEGKIFYEEAEWAYRWGSWDRCVSASENAWLLGFRSERAAMLHFNSYLQRGANGGRSISSKGDRPQKRSLQDILTSVLNFQSSFGAIEVKNKEIRRRWVTYGTSVLDLASSELRQFLFHRPTWDAEEEEMIHILRKELRQISETLKKETINDPECLTPNEADHLWKPYLRPRNVFMSQLLYGALWYHPEEILKCYRAIFRNDYNIDQTLLNEMRWALINHQEAGPQVFSLDKNDRPRLQKLWEDFLLESSASTNIYEKLNAHILRIYYFKKDKQVCAQACEALYQLREEFLNGSLHPNYLSHSTSMMGSESHELKKKLVRYFLSQKKPIDILVYNCVSLPNDSYSAADAKEILSLMEEYQKVIKDLPGAYSSNLARLKRKLASEPEPTYMSTPIAHNQEAQDGVKVDIFWPAFDEMDIGQLGSIKRVETVVLKGGKIWVQTKEYLYDHGKTRVRISALNPDSLTATFSTYLDQDPVHWEEGMARFDVLNDDIFLTGNGCIERYSAETKKWTKIAVPKMTHPRLWIIHDEIWMGDQTGLVMVINPKTGTHQILASSRRKPAQTILDDIKSYSVDKIFLDREKRICVVLDKGMSVYRLREDRKDWDRLLEATDVLKTGKYDRRIALDAISTDRIWSTLENSKTLQYYLATDFLGNGNPFQIDLAEGARLEYVQMLYDGQMWGWAWHEYGNEYLIRYASGGKPDEFIPLRFILKDPVHVPLFGYRGSPKIGPTRVNINRTRFCATAEGFVFYGQNIPGVFFLPKIKVTKLEAN
jgi:hypothetical protein